MADVGQCKPPAGDGDFLLLNSYINNGEEDQVKDLIDSKDFSKQVWDGLTLGALPRYDLIISATPLLCALTRGRLAIVRCLLERGLDYLVGGRDNTLVHAVKCGQFEIVRALVEEFGFELPINVDTQNENLLILAVLSGNIELVEYLVDAGADINYVGPDGSVLHEIARLNNNEMCEFIISRGFTQIDAQNARGETAFLLCMPGSRGDFLYGSWSVCDILVAHGADVNLGSLEYPNIFSRATCMYDLDTIKRLHGYGTDPDMDRGERPIESAVRTNKYTMVHYLAVVLNVPLTGKHILNCLSKCLPRYGASGPLSTKILLLKAGYHICPEVFESLSSDVTKLQPGEASTYINELLSHLRSLEDMCCFRIRRVLGKSLPERVDRLPLPQTLVDFLKLSHVEPVEYIIISPTIDDGEY